MKIYGMLYICPECRKFLPFTPHADGTLNITALRCAEDGYLMKRIDIDSLMIDSFLKHGEPSAQAQTSGT